VKITICTLAKIRGNFKGIVEIRERGEFGIMGQYSKQQATGNPIPQEETSGQETNVNTRGSGKKKKQGEEQKLY